jgi:hypothetical protein
MLTELDVKIQALIKVKEYREALVLISNNLTDREIDSELTLNLLIYRATCQQHAESESGHRDCIITTDQILVIFSDTLKISRQNYVNLMQATSYAALNLKEKSLGSIEKIRADDSNIYCQSRMLKSTILLQNEQYKAAKDCLDNIAKDIHTPCLKELHYLLTGLVAYREHDKDLAYRNLESAFGYLCESSRTNNPELKIQGFKILIELQIDSGRFDESYNVLTKVEALFGRYCSDQDRMDLLFFKMRLLENEMDLHMDVHNLVNAFILHYDKIPKPHSLYQEAMCANLLLMAMRLVVRNEIPTDQYSVWLHHSCFNMCNREVLRVERAFAGAAYAVQISQPWMLSQWRSLFLDLTERSDGLFSDRLINRWSFMLKRDEFRNFIHNLLPNEAANHHIMSTGVTTHNERNGNLKDREFMEISAYRSSRLGL